MFHYRPVRIVTLHPAPGSGLSKVYSNSYPQHILPIMAPQLSDDMRARIIVWHNEKHLSPREIADLAGCCIRTIYNILGYHHDYNTLRDPFTQGTDGRDHSLNMGDLNYLALLITAQPKIYLNEIQEELLNSRDVLVSIPTLSRSGSLHHMALTHKHVANFALGRNELLRATWQAKYGSIPVDYCVWLNAASVDDITN